MARYKDDGIPCEIDSPFFCAQTTITVHQSKSLEDQEIGKQFAPLWRGGRQINSKFSSLMEMMKVPLLSLHSVPVHKFSVLRIEEMVLEHQCSNWPLLDADSCLPLLHLTCVFLVFLTKCCNRSSLKPAQPMCDGRPFASPLFRRLAGRGALFCGFPFRWVLHFVLSLTRSVTVHDAVSCSREDSLFECGRPCDTMSCLFFTALWFQRSQSILVQEIQPAKDNNLTCFKTFPIKATTCLQVGPMSLDWPLDPIARFDLSGPFSSPEDPNDEQQRGALPASTRSSNTARYCRSGCMWPFP